MALFRRQMLGARHHFISLLIAFSAPALLALIPLFFCRTGHGAFLNVYGGLAFYSLLLLPAALRFDFRRDLDRMLLLKSLPLTSKTTVLGQLAAPVVLASIFQLCVLVVAAWLRPMPMYYLGIGWLMMLPMNLLIFALDNLLFLLYPYRHNQEGLEIFLRTTLTFTAKGILFAVALAAVAAWALAAGWLVRHFGLGRDVHESTRMLFLGGIGLLLAGSALVATRMTIVAYERFDPSQDVPA